MQVAAYTPVYLEAWEGKEILALEEKGVKRRRGRAGDFAVEGARGGADGCRLRAAVHIDAEDGLKSQNKIRNTKHAQERAQNTGTAL